MADLDISHNIFTADGSLYFKSKIAEKKADIPSYSNNKLVQEKEHLAYKKLLMTDKLDANNLSPAKTTTYKIYLNDVNDLINKIDTRLRSGEGRGRKSRKSRKSRSRNGRSRKGRKGRKSRKSRKGRSRK